MAACEHGMPLTLGCDDCTIARLNKQRQDDEALIQRMLAALERCRFDSLNMTIKDMQECGDAATAARTRLAPPPPAA